ncbi:SRPBCC domain-containing protein [Cohnella sp. LGH]|uniref:SRPBCC domain-containing protein n=1 Tax=Cohnella sp. LGH TaxID=1619153 RepID=UPI001ADAACC4|nr:SRPBCC domain-containing protein [Cohnella sp. LGH]QTH43123.1 SRPBCC domain-containing protein [Cohnella sp. LGH]
MSDQIEVKYTFNAPRKVVFKAFTDSQHLQNWWGPQGWTFQIAKADFRSGGTFYYSQQPADGDNDLANILHSTRTPKRAAQQLPIGNLSQPSNLL